MTLSQLLAAAFSDLGFQASPPTDVVTRITRYVNEGYSAVMRTPGLQGLRLATLTVSSVAGQKFLQLGPAIQQIQRIVDQAHNVALRKMTDDEFRKSDPQELQTGTPWRWVDMGFHPVAKQPNGSSIWAVSTSASDTQSIGGAGVDLNGQYIPFGATLTGTTPVRLTTATLSVLTVCNLISGANGIVSLMDGTTTPGPNTLGTISQGATTTMYRSARLWPTASQSSPYTVDVIVPILTLVGQGDTPFIPDDFHDVLVEYARMREYERRDDTRFGQATQYYQDSIKRLKDRVWNDPDYRPAARAFGVNGTPSNLGPDFPATGRW